AIAALLTVNMLFVTLVLALAQRMPGWGAGLAVSGFLLGVAIIAALVGWHKRVRSPMARTRRALQEDYGALKQDGKKQGELDATSQKAGVRLNKERLA